MPPEPSAAQRSPHPSVPSPSGLIVANILNLSGGEILSRCLAFIATAYLARVLGPYGFGIIGFATAFFGYASLAVSVGFETVGAREVARAPQEAARIAISVIVVRLGLAVVAAALMALVALLLNKPPEVKIVMALMGLSFFALAINSAWVYKGLEKSRGVGLSLIAEQAVYAGAILLLVKGMGQLAFVPVAQFAGGMAAGLFLLVPLLRHRAWRPDLRVGVAILRSSGFLILSRLFRALIFSFDIVLIGFLLGEREVGLYTAPYRVCFLLLAIAASIHVAYLPSLTRAWAEGVPQTARVVERSIGLAAAVAAPLVIGGMVLATPLMLTLFGPEYGPAAAPARFLILSMGLIFIHGGFRNAFIVGDRLRVDMWIIAAASALNVGINLLAIPRFGTTGAAATTALAEATILLLAFCLNRSAGVRPNLAVLWRPLFAAVVMGACLLGFAGAWPLFASLPVGALIYMAALLALRGVPEDAQPYLKRN